MLEQFSAQAVLMATVAVCHRTSHQWQPKGESKLTGGNTFQQRPVIQSATTWSTPPQPQFQPQMVSRPVKWSETLAAPQLRLLPFCSVGLFSVKVGVSHA